MMNMKPTKHVLSIGLATLITATGLILQGCQSQQDAPTDSTTSDTQATSTSTRLHCPVCGMYTDMTPQWQANIDYNDGTSLQFDVPEHMLAFYVNPQAGKVSDVQRDKANISKMTVIDYVNKSAIDARAAYYVVGSGVKSPMGETFVPFKTRDEAEKFKNEHGGRVITLADVNAELVKSLK